MVRKKNALIVSNMKAPFGNYVKFFTHEYLRVHFAVHNRLQVNQNTGV